MTDKLRELTLLALDSHGCERLKDFYECGPVQRAAVETFLEAAIAQQDAHTWVHLPKGCTHYTRTGDERVTLHFESEASADAWQAASPTPPAQQREPDYTICPTCGGMASDPIVPQEQISDGEFDADKRLMELADKIDHEQNWRLSGIDQRDRLTQEQQDRVTAGVMLRRYADLMAPDSWRLFPPKRLGAGITSFRASTLEKAVEMAMKYQGLNAAPTLPVQQDGQAVLLPEHETEAMHDAVMAVICQGIHRTNTDALWQAYRRAMLNNAAPTPPAPGMAVQALAGEIVEALLADEKDGGYDLAAGLFGPAFSGLVRRWAAAEFAVLKAPAAGSDSGGTT